MNNNSRFDEAGEAESEDQTQDGSSYNNTYPGHYGSNASEGSTGGWFIDILWWILASRRINLKKKSTILELVFIIGLTG